MSRRKIQPVLLVDEPPRASLADRFLRRTRDDVVRLRSLIERTRHGDRSALAQAARLSHSIHGAGAMLGFPDIGAAGGQIERLAGEVMSCGTAPGFADRPASLRQLSERIEELARALEAARQAASGSAGMFQRQAHEMVPVRDRAPVLGNSRSLHSYARCRTVWRA